MKTTITNVLALLLLVVTFNSCSKDESTKDEMLMVDIAAIETSLISGDWKITYYFDTDKEETNDYVSYVFTFNADGVLAASNGSTSVSGAWSITDSDSSNDDSSSNDVDFNIFFSSPDIFVELSDDWEIKKYSSTKIELIDISGGNGGTDLLTFERM